MEKIWPVFLENFVSQDLLTALIPWFLDKYKPWTTRKAILKHVYLGRNPPLFTAVRTLEQTADDDHLVMDFGLDFFAAEDMDVVLAVQMRRRLGLGIWTNIHISKLQVEGKVRVGVKFLDGWPFLSRVRLCFESAPYVQMTARPVSHHGVNVSELPGVAGWMDRMLADVFEHSLVEPNMLVLNVERLVASRTNSMPSSMGDWFEVQEKDPTALIHLEILEAMDLKPSDMNGLADPFIRGAFSGFRFTTKIQKKTLKPKWQQEFKIPIASWDLSTLLLLHVIDKDKIRDDHLGYCELDVAKFRDGQRHDLWIPLQDIKMGRVHIALKVVENVRGLENQGSASRSFPCNNLHDVDTCMCGEKSPVLDESEAIQLEEGEDAYVSVQRPGQPVAKKWQRRQGIRKPDGFNVEAEVLEAMKLDALSSSSSEEDGEEKRLLPKPRAIKMWHWRSSQTISPGSKQDQNSPHPDRASESLAVGSKGTSVRMRIEIPNKNKGTELQQTNNIGTVPATDHETNSASDTPAEKRHMKNMAKGFMKQAGKTLGHVLSRKKSGELESVDLTNGRAASAGSPKQYDEKTCDDPPNPDMNVNL